MASPTKPQHHMKVATKKEKRLIEKAIYVGAFIYPLTTVPQIYQIFAAQDASGVSMLTWLLYIVFTTLFLTYALVEKIRPLIYEYILWLVVEFGVVIGVLLYG